MDPETRLRELNPVRRDDLELDPGLLRRACAPPTGGGPRRPRPTRVAMVLAPAVIAAAILLLVGIGGSSSNFTSKAYAAVAGQGIVHWRTIQTSPGAEVTQVTEGWSYENQAHIVSSDISRNAPVVSQDQLINGDRQTIWTAVSQDAVTEPAPPPSTSPLAGRDPVRAFRAAYMAGSLTKVNDTTYRAPLNAQYRGQPAYATYSFDPQTGLPTALKALGQTMSFTTYEHLDATPTNMALLRLLPGHGTEATPDDPTSLFAALRRPDQLSDSVRERLDDLARGLDGGRGRYSIDHSAIRQVADRVWLLPGRRAICVAVASVTDPGALGSSCVTTAQAAKTGVGVLIDGTTTIVVPDGITSAHVTSSTGDATTIPATGGILRFPGSPQSYTLR